MLSKTISGQIANFDSAAAQESAKLMAVRHGAGRPGDFRDAMIAGIAMSRLATRNTSHFDDLAVLIVDPWS